MTRETWQRYAISVVLIGAGLMLGTATSPSNEALGEIRATPVPPAFQSGGQLSVPVLKEIAATLHQIDSRLARLEVVAQKMQTPRPVTVRE